MSLPGEMGEDALVERLTGLLASGRSVLVGPGDDCAVVEAPDGTALVLKTDCLVEGIHYLTETAGRRVGWKAVARVVSDFAAMGARPEHLLVTVALRPDLPVDWIEDLYRGMDACARDHGAAVVGGETSGLPEGAPVVLSVAGSGSVPAGRWVTRSGGGPGDVLFVTGRLGGSLDGWHLDFTPRLTEGCWLAGRPEVRAMMDLSDGLARDLPRLARASGCGFQLDRDRLPCRAGRNAEEALGDGEDYELLVAVEAAAAPTLEREWADRFPDLALTRIGSLSDGAAEDLQGGWDHFRARGGDKTGGS